MIRFSLPGVVLSLFLVFGSSQSLAQGKLPSPSYPQPSTSGTVDDYHGTKVADPYRGLEDLDSNSTRSWVAAENEITNRYFAALPGQNALRARLKTLFDYEQFDIPQLAGGKYFYRHNTGLQNQSVLLVASTLIGKPQVAFDPNTLSKDGHLIVVNYVPSHRGELVAYGVSVSGSDWVDWHIHDLKARRDLPDVIRWTKYYVPVFANDDGGLYYSAFPAPAPGTELSATDAGNAVFFHRLGRAPENDQKLLESPEHADWQYQVSLSDDGRWLIVASGEGEVGDKGLEDIQLMDLTTTPIVVRPMVQGFQAAYVYAGSDAHRLYFLTSRDAPNGKVVSVDPEQSGAPTDVIAEASEAIDLSRPSVSLVGHRLIVQSIHDAHGRVKIYRLDGTLERDLDLPGNGTVDGFEGRSDQTSTFYSFTDLITPPTIYQLDPASGHSSVLRSPKVHFDQSAFEQQQVFFTARDGTRVPVTLAYRRGLKLDGTHPLLLYAYGGFGISLLPWFDRGSIAWLEMGGVYALANIRGGGEYGESWHQQATGAHRQVAFDDFIDAAQWLIDTGYTSRDRLAIRGDSNGGLLVGACLTQRPDLFGAAIAGVGVMDMLRFDLFGQGAGWTQEFGSPQSPADFPAIYAYSPLHHVRPGTHYPATLIVTGDHDTRVMPMHSFKFAAALQAAQAGPDPILLDLEQSSGHGGGRTVSQAVDQAADELGFLAHRFGMN